MIRRVLLCALASGTFLGLAGCRHHCRSRCFDREPRPYLPPPPGGAFLGPSGRTIPPTSVPTTPGSPFPPPANLAPIDPSPAPAASPPPPNLGVPGDRSFRPAPVPVPPLPKDGGPEILLPDPPPGGAARPAFPPTGQTPEPPAAQMPRRFEASAELPGAAELKPGVVGGQKPTTQGFAELKRKGFRTVAFLQAPGADTSSAKELAERQGLSFVAIESSPEKLADALEKVNALVADRTTHPVYVYAEEGPRSGAVWYLHFRKVDGDAPDVAKLKAGGQGLEDQTNLGKQFWTAIQQVR